MTLADLFKRIEDMDDELSIYAQADPDWRPESRAIAQHNRAGTSEPIIVDGVRLDYLLEVFLAKEIISTWSAWRNGRAPSPKDMCEAVVYYALHDAYLTVGSSG